MFVSEESPNLNAFAPLTVGGSPMLLMFEVDDVDDLARRAIFAGATVEMPVQEKIMLAHIMRNTPSDS
jgi:PhnB protein